MTNTISPEKNTAYLEKRITNNYSKSKFNLNDWIFSQISIPKDANIIELCCGTGAQTQYLAKYSGNKSLLAILDASQDALDKTISRCTHPNSAKIIPHKGDIDDFSIIFSQFPKADLIFCAYGLYYATDYIKILSEIKNKLTKNGKVVIVGPYGKNNEELYSFLTKAEIDIPAPVLYSSMFFMEEIIIKKFIKHFNKIHIFTAKNEIVWKNVNSFMEYWESSTFYSQEKAMTVYKMITNFFKENTEFINTKHIMCAVGEF